MASVLAQTVQKRSKRVVYRIQNIKNFLFGIADIFSLYRLIFEFPVGYHQLYGGG